MSLNFDTKNQTFRQIMGNGLKYWVPKFQRDYAWSQEQWEDLWQDLISIEEGDQHYLGYLVLQNRDSRTFAVIDGQQRLTTISIIILSVLYRLQTLIDQDEESSANQVRMDTLRNTYIGFTDPVSLSTQAKLTLNRNNDAFFRRYLCALQSPPVRNIKRSDRLLGKAREFFDARIEERGLKDGKLLAGFVEELIDKMLFTTITVGSDLNAYKVFETLNARGVQLSVPDLVKNYLFSIIDAGHELHETEIDGLEETWEAVTGQLGQSDFTRFIHAEWNSRNPLVQKNSLFKRIKQNIDDRDDAYDYLRKLEKSSQTYAALQSADDEFWRRPEYSDAISHVAVLNLFNISQPTGLLISAYEKFPPDRFVKILGYIATLSIRYNVIGSRPPNEQEPVYNRLAQEIARERISNLSGVKSALREIYVQDEQFKADFQKKQFRTAQSSKKVRYLLCQLELQANPSHPLEDSQLTLEHILPRNPSPAWLKSFGVEPIDDAVEMLGNMTLLSAEENRGIGNGSFEEKKITISGSSMIINKKVAEAGEWNRSSIEARQSWLADLAVKRWRIEF